MYSASLNRAASSLPCSGHELQAMIHRYLWKKFISESHVAAGIRTYDLANTNKRLNHFTMEILNDFIIHMKEINFCCYIIHNIVHKTNALHQMRDIWLNQPAPVIN